MTIAPRLIWLGAPVRLLLPGLPERFVDSLLVPLGQSRAARWFAAALGNLKFASLAACAVLVGWHVQALFASAKCSFCYGTMNPSAPFRTHTSRIICELVYF